MSFLKELGKKYVKADSNETYRVVWEIDIDAATPKDAAQEALETMREHGHTATVFTVTDSHGKKTEIDLDEV